MPLTTLNAGTGNVNVWRGMGQTVTKINVVCIFNLKRRNAHEFAVNGEEVFFKPCKLVFQWRWEA